jgi:hypothetical protein
VEELDRRGKMIVGSNETFADEQFEGNDARAQETARAMLSREFPGEIEAFLCPPVLKMGASQEERKKALSRCRFAPPSNPRKPVMESPRTPVGVVIHAQDGRKICVGDVNTGTAGCTQ